MSVPPFVLFVVIILVALVIVSLSLLQWLRGANSPHLRNPRSRGWRWRITLGGREEPRAARVREISMVPRAKFAGAIAREYEAWERAMCMRDRVIDRVRKRGGGDAEHFAREARNILERWAISEEQNTRDRESARKKMRAEFEEKKVFASREDIDLAMNDIDGCVACANADAHQCIISNATPTIRFGKFSANLPRARLALLLDLVNGEPEPVLLVAMRYARIFAGGQQWSIPARVYDVLIEKYGVTLEGFASPINSQLLRARARFCSLFPDVDAPFGSVGDFFAQDLEGIVSVINPPYIESLLNEVARKCVRTLANAGSASDARVAGDAGSAFAPTRMFVVVPTWRDAEFYFALESLAKKWHERVIVSEPRATYFEDAHTGERILGTFPTTMFILSNDRAKTPDYDALIDAMTPPAELLRARTSIALAHPKPEGLR